MAIKTVRRTIHFEVGDLRELDRLAREESNATASTVTAAQLVRRIVREWLTHRKEK